MVCARDYNFIHVAILFVFMCTEHLVAETSVLVTNSEQLFSWDECGLNLYIPENSLPANLQQCSIHIKATIMGDYQLPQDTHLVSAVYWIECVPKCQFSRPLTLEIQHCAKPEGASKLCFVKANSMDRGEDGVKFETVPGNFSCHSSYGFIELDSFSLYGIGEEGAEDREYSACSYYSGENKSPRIHFTICWNTKLHNEVCISLLMNTTIKVHTRSILGKRPWVLKHNLCMGAYPGHNFHTFV